MSGRVIYTAHYHAEDEQPVTADTLSRSLIREPEPVGDPMSGPDRSHRNLHRSPVCFPLQSLPDNTLQSRVSALLRCIDQREQSPAALTFERSDWPRGCRLHKPASRPSANHFGLSAGQAYGQSARSWLAAGKSKVRTTFKPTCSTRLTTQEIALLHGCSRTRNGFESLIDFTQGTQFDNTVKSPIWLLGIVARQVHAEIVHCLPFRHAS